MNENRTLTFKTSKQVRLLTAVTAVVVVIAILAAIVLASLPSSVLEFDMTANDLYGITDQTENLINSLEHSIDITVVTESSALDEKFVKFMEKYAALSDKLSLTFADPVLQPSVLEKYGVENNTVLVSCPETGRKATYLVSGFEGYDSAALMYDYNSFYMYGTLNMSTFDAEGQLSSAITKVISDNTNKIYYMAGHGETALGTAVAELIGKANYTEEYLDLLTLGYIPEDCALLICNAPSSDISEAELKLLLDYLGNGGDMILLCDKPELTNFCLLMQHYGIQMEQGHLADLANYYEAYASQFGYYCFWPVLNQNSTLVSNVTSNAMILSGRPLSFVTPVRRGSVVESFMSSSSYGVNYVDENNMTEGTFHVGAVATEEVEEGVTSSLTVISSGYFADDNLLSSFSSISNKDILMNCINSNFEDVTVLTIPARTLAYERNTFTNTTMWGLFFAVFVPLIFIVAGFVFWTQRRKK